MFPPGNEYPKEWIFSKNLKSPGNSRSLTRHLSLSKLNISKRYGKLPDASLLGIAVAFKKARPRAAHRLERPVSGNRNLAVTEQAGSDRKNADTNFLAAALWFKRLLTTIHRIKLAVET